MWYATLINFFLLKNFAKEFFNFFVHCKNAISSLNLKCDATELFFGMTMLGVYGFESGQCTNIIKNHLTKTVSVTRSKSRRNNKMI